MIKLISLLAIAFFSLKSVTAQETDPSVDFSAQEDTHQQDEFSHQDDTDMNFSKRGYYTGGYRPYGVQNQYAYRPNKGLLYKRGFGGVGIATQNIYGGGVYGGGGYNGGNYGAYPRLGGIWRGY